VNEAFTATEARILNRLVGSRPRALPTISLIVNEGFSMNCIRSACRNLERRGLVRIESKPSGFDDVGATLFYRAAEHATLVEVPTRGRPRTDDGPTSVRGRVMAAVRQFDRPATLREVCAAAGLSETAVAKVLKAAMADGLVTRKQGPAPAVGSVRPWLWEVCRVAGGTGR